MRIGWSPKNTNVLFRNVGMLISVDAQAERKLPHSLLKENAEDLRFLEKLNSQHEKLSPNMCSTVSEVLDYLNNRKTFWDQHGPKEKRKKEEVQIYQVACSDNSKF
ncbi:uncharacterized protein LOC111713941 [Eurytemora carolleeae]|uniref:uncharacterized protein LOC111713941 n=1 Tax=Eurytemora carolleeae TaxID=1294199 RepID=UPI000C78F104|nr:uncharacterized protein LOC111713941 [Eurytemora carolleeae]|eukprot:XP_023344704.1 uncharacterized protein LOC111713941 [Eurytemora affinis]